MTPQSRWWSSIAIRQAFAYAGLVIVTMVVLLAIVYLQTLGTWQNRIDRQIETTSQRLVDYYDRNGAEKLAAHVIGLLGDGIDSDTEVYTLLAPDGHKVAGNLSASPSLTESGSGIGDYLVERAGRTSHSRLSMTKLHDGAVLIVGRDMEDQRQLEVLLRRASAWAALAAIAMAIAGSLIFRRQLERRVGAIRKTAHEIERGDLAQRVPISPREDEFSRLSRDINAMLDRIHDLMEGVRHVSNTIAHNIRTPLSRVVAGLHTAQATRNPETIPAVIESAIGEIQDVNVLLEKLLRIAEVESGTRRQAFAAVSLNAVVLEVLELYDALAEAKGVALSHELTGEPLAEGDGDLLANAVANLLDNAIKYTPSGGRVHVSTATEASELSITVADSGRGIPEEARARVGTRFFRVDRSVPGWGLGLASARAIVVLHGGTLDLKDAGPGLIARITLPPFGGA